MKPRFSLHLLLLISILFGPPVGLIQATEPDEDTKAAAEKLMQRARDLKADGRLDESAELAAKAKQLQQQGRAAVDAKREPPSKPTAPPGERRERLHEDLRDLEQEGRGQETGELLRRRRDLEASRRAEVRRQARELQERREKERREISPFPEPLDPPHRDIGPMMGPLNRPVGEVRERLQHLQEAIKHLHAAGLHEAAEHLEAQADRARQELQRQREPRRDPMPPDIAAASKVIEDLKAELEELRARVRQLERSLDETRALMKRRLTEDQ